MRENYYSYIHSLHKANLWNVCSTVTSLHGQSLDFHCFIANLKVRSKSIDLKLSGMSSYILGTKNDKDSIPLYTDFTGLV